MYSVMAMGSCQWVLLYKWDRCGEEVHAQAVDLHILGVECRGNGGLVGLRLCLALKIQVGRQINRGGGQLGKFAIFVAVGALGYLHSAWIASRIFEDPRLRFWGIR